MNRGCRWSGTPLRVALTVLCASLFALRVSASDLSVSDDSGTSIHLPQVARRIVSLSPHATELLYAAGAGAALVGVSRYSDYPPDARIVPRVGDSAQLDLEAVVALHPDLVVAWGSALPERTLAVLRRLGLPVFRSEPHTLDAIADNVERLAQLAGTGAVGKPAASALRARISSLRSSHVNRAAVMVFVQVWPSPLMTVNHEQVISDALAVCGARNLFDTQALQVPTIDPENVVKADPDVILTGLDHAGAEAARMAFARWHDLPQLRAVARHHLIGLDADLLSRPGPRAIDAAELLCEALDEVRAGHPLAEAGMGMRP